MINKKGVVIMKKILSIFLSAMLCVSIGGNSFTSNNIIDKTPMILLEEENNEEMNESIPEENEENEENIPELLSDHGGLGGGEDNM